MKIIKSAPIVISLALLLFVPVTQKANAETITFDDIDATGGALTIPNGYAGFDWSNFGVLNSSGPAYASSGYLPGTVSAPNVAFNEFGNPAEITDGGTDFDLTSADITAAWNDGLAVEVIGFAGGVDVDDTTVYPSSTSPTLYTFDYKNVDTIEFISSGGTPNPDYVDSGEGTQIALDNVTINGVPEPSSWAMMLGGLGVLAVWRLRSRKSLI